MTPAEKAEKRSVRHQLIREVFKHHFSKDVKITHTSNQLRQMSRTVAAQLLAGKNPHDVESFES